MPPPEIRFAAAATPPADAAADWLVAGVWEGDAPHGPVADLDARLGGVIHRLRESGDVTGKRLELVPLLAPTGVAAKRVLVAGLGKRAEADRLALHEAAAAAARAATRKPLAALAFALPEPPALLSPGEYALSVCVGLNQGCTGPGLRKAEQARFWPKDVTLLTPDPHAYEAAVRRAEAESAAVTLARELVNLPPCDLYPESFARIAAQVVTDVPGLECEVWDEARLRSERMGAVLAVGSGSDRPPRLVVLRYRGGRDGHTLAVVGKGVTFDSGGLSIKASDQMIDMKCDMAGGAAAFAAAVCAATLRLPVNLLTVIPLVENMTGGRAMKLGDVLTTRSGKTVEVLNTDAEGRLILADALTYAAEQKADRVIDLATLTGACMVGLGTEIAGLFTNNEAWGEAVRRAAKRAGERVWPMPMDAHFEDLLKSNVADLRNVAGTRYGGAATAAKFLQKFVGATPWVHLDIAGPAWAEAEGPSRDPGATGFGVRTLVELMAGEEARP